MLVMFVNACCFLVKILNVYVIYETTNKFVYTVLRPKPDVFKIISQFYVERKLRSYKYISIGFSRSSDFCYGTCKLYNNLQRTILDIPFTIRALRVVFV